MWSALTYTREHSSEFRALTTALLSSTQPHRLAMSFMATRATDKQHMGQGRDTGETPPIQLTATQT